MESDPPLSSLASLLRELDERPEDTEHGSVADSHESEWCIAAMRGGYVIFEHLEDGGERHMRDVPHAKIIDLWSRLARGDIGFMRTALQALQKDVERLSDGELSKFCIWFNRYLTRYEDEKHKDDTKGIHYKDVLQAFKRANLIKGDKPNILEASSAGLDLARFYKETRVKGCRVDDEGDMLAAFWGAESGGEFRLAYMRQLIPLPPPRDEDEIWALTVDMRFPMSEKLQRLGSGHKWFRALRHLEAFEHFVLASRVAMAVEDLKPSRSLLSYQNVE